MGDRALVAVWDGTDWSGFEVTQGAHPWAAGEFANRLLEFGLADSARRIREARFFTGSRPRATPTSHGARGDLSWLYTLEPGAGLARAWVQWPRASADAPPGFECSRWREVARCTVDERGRLLPSHFFPVVPAPWPDFPIEAAWPASDRDAAARHDVRRRVERDALAAGFTLEGFLDLVEHAVSETLFHAPWTQPPAPPLYVEMEWTTESTWLRVNVGGVELCYPHGEWARRGLDAELSLFSAPAQKVKLKLTRAELAARLPERQKVEGIFISALPSEGWFFALLDVIRARRVPDPRGEELLRLATPAEKADDWRVFIHADGRVWSIRPAAGGFQLRLGAPDDDPVFKERKATAAELEALIAEQLADGFTERKST